MTYKTILVHLNREARAHALLDVGCDLAARFGAHLIGCHVPTAFDRDASKDGASESQQIAGIFDAMTRGTIFTAEYRELPTGRRDPADTMTIAAHAADLVIASQADPDWKASDVLDFPGRLALGAGRPVLVVPLSGARAGVPTSATIAWKPGRESAQAITGALPLLRCADRVSLITVVADHAATPDLLSETEVAAALKRHGVEVETARLTAPDAAVGDAILNAARAHGSGLLVMGCYGHTRLREYVLGGVTRQVMREMTIPTLFAH